MIGDLAKALAEETAEREKFEQELKAVTEQRDRLAEALDRIANNNVQDLPETDYAYELGRMEGIAKIALQSLTTNDERTCADS
jgi:hypothetical protein